jgi:hypothetical protein
MSPQPEPRMDVNTAAEIAWYEQEPSGEHLAVERSSDSRRLLMLVGVSVALVAGVLLVAGLAGSSRHAARILAATPALVASSLETSAAPLQPPPPPVAVTAPAAVAAPAKATQAKAAVAPRRVLAPTRKLVRALHLTRTPPPAHKPPAPRGKTVAMPAPKKPSYGHFGP